MTYGAKYAYKLLNGYLWKGGVFITKEDWKHPRICRKTLREDIKNHST